jgi:guanine deaminase
MRQAVVISRLREGSRRETSRGSSFHSAGEIARPSEASKESGSAEEAPDVSRGLRVDWKESLYLATRGGKQAMGLGGCLEVGMEFDAQRSKFTDLLKCRSRLTHPQSIL